MHLLTQSSKGIASTQLAGQIGVTQRTAWHLLTRLRIFTTHSSTHFTGTIEADETFVGGLEKNKYLSEKRGELVKKAVVIGVLDRENKQVKAEHIKDTKAKTIKKYLYDNIEVGSTLYTDDYNAYRNTKHIFNHESTKHGQGEYVKYQGNKVIHTNSIESFWAIFKRGYVGVYHYMSKKHLQKYINEYVFRYNNKKSDFSNVIDYVVKGRT